MRWPKAPREGIEPAMWFPQLALRARMAAPARGASCDPPVSPVAVPTGERHSHRGPSHLLLLPFVLFAIPASAFAQSNGGSITDTSLEWPGWDQVLRVATLRDYNTRIVIAGVSCLGLASGLIGCFMLLRKRALLGDALSHATFPGIAAAFMVMTAAGLSGKSLGGLLIGATLSGAVGVGCILLITALTRIKQDAALGIVLSVFFGLGVAGLGVIQNMGTGNAAGLESFIYGKTASMLASDAIMTAVAAGLIALACTLMYKEFTVLSFDQEYADAQGKPVLLLDMIMMTLVVGVTVIGLQAVGLILMVALLVIPAAAARFWTHHLPTMLLASGILGALSGMIGAALSALVPRLPAGAVIVVVAGFFFAVSMFFGPARGVISRGLERVRLKKKVLLQHVLRAMYELSEPLQKAEGDAPQPVTHDELLRHRAWSIREARASIRVAVRRGFMHPAGERAYVLTKPGRAAAWRVVRNHRLWELFLIQHADIAPSHVDRDADQVEHVLHPEMIDELETLLAAEAPELAMPASPHRLAAAGTSGGGAT